MLLFVFFLVLLQKVIFQKVEVETDNQFITMQVTLRNNTNGDVVADVDANLLQDLDTTLFVSIILSTFWLKIFASLQFFLQMQIFKQFDHLVVSKRP